MRIFCVLLSLICGSYTLSAQISRQEIRENITRSGANYYAYPGPQQESLTPPPTGYTPYYISHYGRHGSRYLIFDGDYDVAYHILMRADSASQLTPFGKEVLKKVVMIRQEAYKRYGELTLRGAEQHRAIGRRMYERSPEVFKGHTRIDAKSTVVIRCILSMENALQELYALNPQLDIRHDASEHDMWYMNFDDRVLNKLKMPAEVQQAYDEFCHRHQHNDRIMRQLFKNERYWKKEVDSQDLAYHLFKLASNLQSTELRREFTLYDIFNEQEIYDLWLQTNAWWYINFGPCPLNGGISPYTQRNLLHVMLNEADSCLQLPHPGATLRYGHEVCVMPLVCLLELDNYGRAIDDLEQLDDEGWFSYRIFPMACNVQLIFYRPDNGEGDILMKALLNENEARLPLTPVEGPYYKWKDFKEYFNNKLNAFEQNVLREKKEERK